MVLKIAHRGASGYANENSIEAFQIALKLNSDVIEFDVRSTKDGKLIVMHDPLIDRVTNGKGRISNLTLNELRNYRLSNMEPIPTFFEVLDLLMHKCICKIDIKEPNSVNTVMKSIIKNGLINSCIITSEIYSVLEKVRKFSSKIKIELGGYKGKISVEQELRKIKNLGGNIMSPHFSTVTEDIVKIVNRNGIDVHVWTVNDKKTIQKMKNIGVNGITTDFPDRISD